MTAPALVEPGTLRIARTLTSTVSEGPGRRSAVWVQGCTIRCPGCFNPQLWTSRGGVVVDTVEFSETTLREALAAGVEGVTLLGGEPFEQAAPLALLGERFRAEGLSVMTFTGYEYDDLLTWSAERADIAALLDATDLLADGPFLADRLDSTRPWIGSTNQSLRPLTERYRNELAHDLPPDRVEVTIDPAGRIAVNGWADLDALDGLLDGLGTRARM